VAFTIVTITCDYDLADGTDPTGTVTFTPTTPMVNGPTVVAAPVIGRVDVDGILALSLAANTDPATAPAGSHYRVDELLNNVSRSYNVQIPHNVGSSIVLSTLTQIADPPGLSFPAAGAAGALLISNNLSDLASTSTARTNLGLGGAATLSVGTTAGTVAAGDDARFVGAATTARSFALALTLR
jgi:hypothetical protein